MGASLIFQNFSEKNYELIPITSFQLKDDSIQVNKVVDETLTEPMVYAIAQLSGKEQIKSQEVQEKLLISRTFWLGTNRYGRDMFSRLFNRHARNFSCWIYSRDLFLLVYCLEQLADIFGLSPINLSHGLSMLFGLFQHCCWSLRSPLYWAKALANFYCGGAHHVGWYSALNTWTSDVAKGNGIYTSSPQKLWAFHRCELS